MNFLAAGAQLPSLRRTRIKICGITNPNDAEAAISLGADALGFNFYRGSKRFLSDTPGERNWLQTLGPFFGRVAVAVNPASLEEARQWRWGGFVDAVQLHGDEDEVFCHAVLSQGIPMIRAFRVHGVSSLANPSRFGTRDVLLDAFRPGDYGGTGEACDWDLAQAFISANPELRVVLSGGLTPDNVGRAIERVRPYAVDVASGVEYPDDPRRKDPARLRDFFQAVAAVR